MAYEAKVHADSISERGVRLTTLEVTFPRIILAEFNTHRVFSRNSASSRAIPLDNQLERVQKDPFIPLYWGANQKGMSAKTELSEADQELAVQECLAVRDAALASARRLGNIGVTGVHKQTVNRYLEPFMWHTVIVTATEWNNFFALRDHEDAQPEIRHIAQLMRQAMDGSRPRELNTNEWHLPLLQPDEAEWAAANPELAIKVCIGRCARVSYLTHDGKRDRSKDIELTERLQASGHMSPFEHAARPMRFLERLQRGKQSNFRGWLQYRKTIRHEADYSKRLKEEQTELEAA